MLQITREDPDNRTVEIIIDGKVTRESMEALAFQIEEKAKLWGKVNILEKYVNLDALEPAAIWEDLKFYFRNVKSFNKIALVTDKSWARTLTKVLSPFFNLETKVFTNEQIHEARRWLAK